MTVDSDILLARLLELHPKVIDLSLDRMHEILKKLGNPQDRLPPVIHIAGTNGKGSSQAMLKAGLEAMGKSVHAYTSPHLAKFHERITLNGTHISETMLASLLAEVEEKNNGAPITFFEVTTAAAFLAFSRKPADFLLLEVGLGGRLDATNVIIPELSIITPISMDHEAYLGDTIEKIAAEKGGIIKANTPVIMGIQQNEARAKLEEIANQLNAPKIIQNQDFQTYLEHDRLVYFDEEGLWDVPKPALIGPHQIDNAGPVIRALKHFSAFEEHAAKAMKNVKWPARLQKLEKGPIVEAAGKGEVWLDGGHNPAAAEKIAQSLRYFPPKPLVLICGMLNTKDVSGYFEPLREIVDHVCAVSIEGEPATLKATETAEFAKNAGLQATAFNSVREAMDSISNVSEKRLLICGSLYLAGRILRENS